MFQAICREHQNTHFGFNDISSKVLPFVNSVDKRGRAGVRATNDNMAHAGYIRV